MEEGEERERERERNEKIRGESRMIIIFDHSEYVGYGDALLKLENLLRKASPKRRYWY